MHPRTLANGPDLYAFPKPIEWHIDATNTGGAILLQGIAEATVRGACARCLEPAEYDVTGEIEAYYIVKPEDAEEIEAEDEDFGEDEIDILPDDKRIDIWPLIRAGLLLELPMMPLCKDDCKGLCPTCGANLNEADCGCAEERERERLESPSNPFSALKDYKFE